MRNLKRALSLTLASVMLLGMMVVGSSAAAGYDDVKDTDNVEAIEVLQAVEVMVGDDRGFGPDRPVTRNEMAVVMGKLLNLDYNYYTSTCPFSDVATWARGWVGACAANGIVSGRGNGIYDGESTVTAVEAASMMMRALGYFKYTEDYADGFLTSTVRQGSEIGIFSGVGTDGTTPMTRNQVAQMALNALRTEMVTFTGTPGVDVNGVKVGYRAEYTPRTSTEAKYHAIEGRTSDVASDANHKGQYYIQLGEQLYDGKLRLDNDAIDDFNRPSRYWEYDGKEIGTYTKLELLEYENVGEVTGKILYDELGKGVIDKYDMDVAIDGVTDPAIVRAAYRAYVNTDGYDHVAGSINGKKNLDFVFNAQDINRNNKAALGDTGTGVLTQVFVDPDEGENGKVWISIINTYLARATQNYDTRREELSVDIYSVNKNSTTSNEFVKDPKDGNSVVRVNLGVDEFPIVKDAAEKDSFLVTVAQGEVQTVSAAEVLSGVSISAFKRNSNVTVDGTTYSFDTTAGFDAAALKLYTDEDSSGTINLKDTTYNVYLDQYGNLIGVEEVEAKKNYVFIAAMDLNDSNLVNGTADARAIFLDGTTDTIRVNMAKSDINTYGSSPVAGDEVQIAGTSYWRNSILNTWCTYTVSNSGVYTLTQVMDVGRLERESKVADMLTDSYALAAKAAQYHQPAGATESTIDKKHITLNGRTTPNTYFSNVYGNEDTVYLVAELDELVNNGNTAANSAWGVISGVDTMTTGIENADMTVFTKLAAANEADDTKTSVDPANYSQNYASHGVYTLYDKDGIVIAAVVVGENNGASKDLVYVHTDTIEREAYNGNTTAKADGDGLWTWTRKVIRDGQETELTEVSEGNSYLERMVQDRWYQVKTNSDGNVMEVYKLPGVGKSTDRDAKFNDSKLTRYKDFALDYKYYDKNGNKTQDAGEIGEIAYTVQNGSSTVLYYNRDFIESKLRMNGRTLYVATDDQTGFIVDQNVRYVIKQWDSNKKETYIEAESSGAAGLKNMIDEINRRNTNNNVVENYTYQVSAILDGNVASSVVIYFGENDYNRPVGPIVGEGNVPTVLTGDSSANVTYNVTQSGRLQANFQYTAPEYTGTNNAKVDLVVNAYVKNDKTGKFDVLWDSASYTGASAIAVTPGGTTAFTWRSGQGDFDTGVELKFEIVSEKLSSVQVKYVDATNKGDLTVTSATENLSTSTAEAVAFTAPSASYSGTGTFAITGVTSQANVNTDKDVTPGTAKDVNKNASNKLIASGDDFVTITVTGLSKVTPTYTAAAVAEAALSDASWGSQSGDGSTLEFAQSVTKASGLKTGEKVGVTITPKSTDKLALDTDALKVTFELEGEEFVFVYPNNNNTTPDPVTVIFTVGTKNIGAATVKSIEKIAAPTITGVTVDDKLGDGYLNVADTVKDTITVTFSEKLAAAPTLTADSSVTLGTGSLASDGMSATYEITAGVSDATTKITFSAAANQIKSDATKASNKAAISNAFEITGTASKLP